MLFQLFALFLGFAVFAVEAAFPGIVSPANGTVIAANTEFSFEYESIADYGVSSYNFTCWIFTTRPRFFDTSTHFAKGYHLGRFSQPNYPAIPYTSNPPPPSFRMPDFSKLGPGWGVGSNETHATVYFAVIEEYADGEPSLGYRMAMTINEIFYTRPPATH
ncbi:hypothetical protein R3P38DRAFT_2869503 [Favolaschia claudopus]|uniref:Uncharacterized protein n=1 Tax=Favolaschia claudopus TaxID=2862362 RepID=A0AAW0DA96_9AGAR